MKLRKILKEMGGTSAREYVEYFEDGLEDIVSKYNSHTTDSDFIPTGPDSSKFSAKRSGMIEVAHKVNIYGGQYQMSRFFPVAIKVGGKVDSNIHNQIKNDVEQLWASLVNDSSVETNKGTLRFDFTQGTSWRAYGITLS